MKDKIGQKRPLILKINKLGKLPESEIEEIGLFDNEPDNLTYKETYNLFFKTVIDRIKKSVDNQ